MSGANQIPKPLDYLEATIDLEDASDTGDIMFTKGKRYLITDVRHGNGEVLVRNEAGESVWLTPAEMDHFVSQSANPNR